MKRKTEKAWFDEQWVPMITHLKAFIENGDQEELHLFRVQVKKVRAMLMLLDSTSAKHQLSKDLKPVRNIFKLAGNIRNAHINLQLAARYNLTNEEFIMGQLHEIEKGTQDFKELEKKHLKSVKRSYQGIIGDMKPIDNETIVEFYKTNLEQSAIILANMQFGEDLHDLRKKVKILLYNRKIAHKALDGKLALNYAYLDKLQDVIGNWHDNILAVELLSSAAVNDQLAVTKLKRQNTRQKKAITVLIQDFASSATLPLNVNENTK